MSHDEAIPEPAELDVGDRPVPLRIHPSPRPADAVVLVFPAMGVPAAFYDPLCARLAAEGRHAVAVELPGTGDSDVDVRRRSDLGYQALLDGEVDAAVAFAGERWPDLPVVLAGHSLGGQLALLYAAAEPGRVAAVALPVAGTIHWRAYPGRTGPGTLMFTQFARLAATVLGVFPGDRLGFGGRQPRTLIRDWAHTGLTGRWEPAGAAVDYEQLLAALDVPVLSVTLEGDNFAPPSAATSLTAPIDASRVEHVTLTADDLGHPVDHIRWLRHPEAVASVVSEWLTAALADRTA